MLSTSALPSVKRETRRSGPEVFAALAGLSFACPSRVRTSLPELKGFEWDRLKGECNRKTGN
jgi:hypothetical protein